MANKIRLLPYNWTLKDYYDFVTAFRVGNTVETFSLALKLIVSWDYKTPLTSKNPIMKLGVAESAEVIRTVMETIGTYMEDLSIEDVEVDFSSWDTERFMLFDDMRRTGKFDKSEKMAREIVKWDSIPEGDEPFTFTVAATVYKAITEAYKQIVSGKN